MNEYVLVEFVCPISDLPFLVEKLSRLNSDFIQLNVDPYVVTYNHDGNKWTSICGKISSEYATLITLRDVFLAERMRVSYISTKMKDKYRGIDK